MRENLFRGINVKNNRWVHGGYHHHEKKTSCVIEFNDEVEYSDIIMCSGFSDWNMAKPIDLYEVFPHSVGQYIGIRDINGVKIYEGDILLAESRDSSIRFRGVVVFSEASFVINQSNGMVHYRWRDYECEVIGNVIDNHDSLLL